VVSWETNEETHPMDNGNIVLPWKHVNVELFISFATNEFLWKRVPME